MEKLHVHILQQIHCYNNNNKSWKLLLSWSNICVKAEKNTLVEALRDGEGEQVRLRALVEEKEEQSSLLVRRAEQRTQELQSSRYDEYLGLNRKKESEPQIKLFFVLKGHINEFKYFLWWINK